MAGITEAVGAMSSGTAMQTAGTIFKGVSTFFEGRRAADIQEENIRNIRGAKEDQIRESRRLTARSVGSARARLAAGGITLDGDDETPLAIMEEILRLGEEDIQAIERTAGIQERQARLRQQSALAKGTSSLFSSFIEGGSTILTRQEAKKKGVRIK